MRCTYTRAPSFLKKKIPKFKKRGSSLFSFCIFALCQTSKSSSVRFSHGTPRKTKTKTKIFDTHDFLKRTHAHTRQYRHRHTEKTKRLKNTHLINHNSSSLIVSRLRNRRTQTRRQREREREEGFVRLRLSCPRGVVGGGRRRLELEV